MIDTLFILITSTLYSLIEIEIEGPEGWCKKIPTPYIIDIGTKKMTLYHLYMLLFIIVIVSFQTNLSITIESLLYTISNVILFIVLEDTMWFIFNPYYTIKNYKKEKIWWHSNQPWFFGLPSDIYKSSIFILFSSYLTNNLQLLMSFIFSLIYVPITIYFSPYYHRYYTKTHKIISS